MSQEHTGLPPGQNIWVKLRGIFAICFWCFPGHPWWPARVVQSKKVASKQHDYIVIFYGDNTFGFVNDYTPAQFVVEKFENPDKHKKKHNIDSVNQVLTLVPDNPNGEEEIVLPEPVTEIPAASD